MADIQSYREIHKIGTHFVKGHWYQQQTLIQINDETCGVFGVRDRKKAAARRKLFLQAGTRAAVLECESTMVGLVKLAVEKIKRDAANGTVNLVKWWSLMTADILGSLAFGEPFRLVDKKEVIPTGC